MTFQEIDASLPNGFHDAGLERLGMDYVRRRLHFDLLVWIGDLDDRPRRELYRPAHITVENVAFLVIEPPDPSESWLEPGVIRIDTRVGVPRQSSSILPNAPVNTSLTWMYLNELNRFLLFAGGETSLEWTGPEVIYNLAPHYLPGEVIDPS